MDGITGLNPEVAKANLNDFSECMWDAQDTLYMELQEMMEELSRCWYSPKAVEFGNTFIPKLSEVLNEIADRSGEIREDATIAYNQLATSNGIGTIEDFHHQKSMGVFFTNTNFREVGDGGVVGMDVENVKGNIIPNGYHNVKTALNKFDEVPMSIAFYDPEGEMKARYKTTINTLKIHIMNIINELVRSLMTSLQEEQVKIETAKAEAADAMNTAA